MMAQSCPVGQGITEQLEEILNNAKPSLQHYSEERSGLQLEQCSDVQKPLLVDCGGSYYPILIGGSPQSTIFEGSLMEKQRWEESERRRAEERRSEKRKSEKKKRCQVREKVGKSRNSVFFPMMCGSGGSKSRLTKAAGAEEPCGQMRDEKLHAVVARSTFASQKVVEMSKKCTPLWREAHFQVKMYKAHHSRTTFGS